MFQIYHCESPGKMMMILHAILTARMSPVEHEIWLKWLNGVTIRPLGSDHNADSIQLTGTQVNARCKRGLRSQLQHLIIKLFSSTLVPSVHWISIGETKISKKVSQPLFENCDVAHRQSTQLYDSVNQRRNSFNCMFNPSHLQPDSHFHHRAKIISATAVCLCSHFPAGNSN